MNPLKVPCPHCHAPIWQHCTIMGTGQRLTLSAAHPSRLEKAGLQADVGAVEQYRRLYEAKDEDEQ